MKKGQRRRERQAQHERKRDYMAGVLTSPEFMQAASGRMLGQSMIDHRGHYTCTYGYDEHGQWVKTTEFLTPHVGERIDLLKAGKE